MTARLVVVTGTGTGIGKTHLAEAILLALGRLDLRVAGVKPVESGVGPDVTDAERLRAASSFHVKHTGVTLAAPLSPHLAARQQGAILDPSALAQNVQSARPGADVLLVELAGGLFTPITDDSVNADLAALLDPDFLLLFAPDRLGTLHDTLATFRAAQGMRLRIDAVALIAPEVPDPSTGTNAAELSRLLPITVLPTAPRAPAATLASHPALGTLTRALLAPRAARAPA